MSTEQCAVEQFSEYDPRSYFNYELCEDRMKAELRALSSNPENKDVIFQGHIDKVFSISDGHDIGVLFRYAIKTYF